MVGTTRREHQAEHALESCSCVLLEAEVFPVRVTEAAPIQDEDDDFFDVCEPFQCRVDFRCHPCIRSDPWRGEAPAEVHGRSPCLRHRAFLVQRQGEVWTSNRLGSRAVRWATEHGIEFREVARVLFGEGRSSE